MTNRLISDNMELSLPSGSDKFKVLRDLSDGNFPISKVFGIYFDEAHDLSLLEENSSRNSTLIDFFKTLRSLVLVRIPDERSIRLDAEAQTPFGLRRFISKMAMFQERLDVVQLETGFTEADGNVDIVTSDNIIHSLAKDARQFKPLASYEIRRMEKSSPLAKSLNNRPYGIVFTGTQSEYEKFFEFVVGTQLELMNRLHIIPVPQIHQLYDYVTIDIRKPGICLALKRDLNKELLEYVFAEYCFSDSIDPDAHSQFIRDLNSEKLAKKYAELENLQKENSYWLSQIGVDPEKTREIWNKCYEIEAKIKEVENEIEHLASE